ncbi:MAG: hypothetical protein ACKO24_06925 [Leptolyngbyaceae cyanobacterium]
MPFNINQLNHLDYEKSESVLPNYLDQLVEQFAQSPEGKAHAQEYPEFGKWISSFTEMAYVYEGFTLPKMTRREVQIMMEHLLPRKITLGKPADAANTIPELVALWNFLGREYHLRQAAAIAAYLTSIEGKFTDWMFDPAKGGMAKNFLMSGMQAGFDMTTQEGLNAFQLAYNEQLLAEKSKESFLQKLGNLFKGASPEAPLLSSSPQPAQPTPKPPSKGFEVTDKGKKNKRKKK